jgi:taurine dioxygenase
MNLTINRLSPILGAEVLGANLAEPMADTRFSELRQAWLDANGVLVIRDQDLTPDQHIAFSRRFGELETHVLADYLLPGYPTIYRVSNKTKDGKPLGRAKAGTYWHSDLSYMRNPAMASLLYAIEIPPLGGDTMFANMYAAYDTLSPKMREIVSNLHATHDFSYAARGVFSGERVSEERLAMAPAVEHPVVRTHPESGRKALYVNPGFTAQIAGLEPLESTALLEFLNRHSTQPKNVYRHRWQARDLVLWDNRCTMHHAIDDYESVGERYMHRTTVLGDKVV